MIDDLPLPDLENGPGAARGEEHGPKSANDLEAVFDVPVSVSAVLKDDNNARRSMRSRVLLSRDLPRARRGSRSPSPPLP